MWSKDCRRPSWWIAILAHVGLRTNVLRSATGQAESTRACGTGRIPRPPLRHPLRTSQAVRNPPKRPSSQTHPKRFHPSPVPVRFHPRLTVCRPYRPMSRHPASCGSPLPCGGHRDRCRLNQSPPNRPARDGPSKESILADAGPCRSEPGMIR